MLEMENFVLLSKTYYALAWFVMSIVVEGDMVSQKCIWIHAWKKHTLSRYIWAW